MEDMFIWLNSFSRDILSNLFSSVFSGECKSNARLDGKVALVTGCTGGIGKITALELCKRGARVIMACRNIEKAIKVADEIREKVAQLENPGEVVVMKLDLVSFKSVRECAEHILATEKWIHILINNAGISCPWELTKDGHEIHFQTNYLGHFLFTLLLLPRIISSAPSRIINVASLMYTFASGEMDLNDVALDECASYYAYSRSKLAVIQFTKELALRLKGYGVTTYSLHPGFVRTAIFRHADKAIHPWAKLVLHSSVSRIYQKSPEQGAQTTLHCALDEEAGKESGLFYSDCKPLKPIKTALDKQKAKELWDFSWYAVGLPEDYNPFV